jgi:hypothetical protein
MPSLPFVPGVLRFTIEGTTPTHPWANVFHMAYTGAPPSALNCQNWAGEFLTIWTAQFAPLMSTPSTIEKSVVVDLSSATGAGGEIANTSPGSRGTAEVPGSAAVLVSKTISRRYRGGHPRSYIFAGIQTDMVNASHWSAALVAAVDAAYGAFWSTINGYGGGGVSSAGEVIVSYVDKALFPVAPFRRAVPLVEPVTSHVTTARIATQRRRIGR